MRGYYLTHSQNVYQIDLSMSMEYLYALSVDVDRGESCHRKTILSDVRFKWQRPVRHTEVRAIKDSSMPSPFRATDTLSWYGQSESKALQCSWEIFRTTRIVLTVNSRCASLRPQSEPQKLTNNTQIEFDDEVLSVPHRGWSLTRLVMHPPYWFAGKAQSHEDKIISTCARAIC